MPLDAGAAGTRLAFLVPGMRCGGCMTKIERGLAAAPGVLSARANLSAHRVAVQFDPARTDGYRLIAALAAIGYEAKPYDAAVHGGGKDRTGQDLLLRLGVAGFGAMNVMLLSISVWSGADGATRDLFHWVSALIALPCMAYAGMPFYRSAYGALKAGRLNMDVPISLAIVLAAASSTFETSHSGQHAYFDAGIMLLFFLLIGRYLEHVTRTRARSAAGALLAMTGRVARQILPDGHRAEIAVDDIAEGMVLEVRPGERLPADGEIAEGRTDLDRAMLTGESVPAPCAAGDEVHAGVTNLSGLIRVRVTRAGPDTVLAEIARLVSEAERGKGRYDVLADRAARSYAPVVHLMAAIAFAGWMAATGDLRLSLQIAVAVLIITCPCALALAVPTVHTVAVSRLFQAGIFVKDGAALERLAEIDRVVFDKTGTLTDGTARLADGPDPDSPAWPVAAALGEASRHPLSQAIARHAAAAGVVPAPVTDIVEAPGFGVEGRLDGEIVRLGRPVWVGAETGQVAVSLPGGATAAFRFAESLRPEAAETCRALAADGLTLEILSGDGPDAVDRVADACGIKDRLAGLTPQEKHAHMERLAAGGHRTLMVGDGLNDNPALAAAHVSISPASASDATQAVADLVFTGQSLGPVAAALETARTAQRRAMQSIGIALVYNAVAVPAAMAGYVTPLVAALAMSGSSIVVILNALRTKVQK